MCGVYVLITDFLILLPNEASKASIKWQSTLNNKIVLQP